MFVIMLDECDMAIGNGGSRRPAAGYLGSKSQLAAAVADDWASATRHCAAARRRSRRRMRAPPAATKSAHDPSPNRSRRRTAVDSRWLERPSRSMILHERNPPRGNLFSATIAPKCLRRDPAKISFPAIHRRRRAPGWRHSAHRGRLRHWHWLGRRSSVAILFLFEVESEAPMLSRRRTVVPTKFPVVCCHATKCGELL